MIITKDTKWVTYYDLEENERYIDMTIVRYKNKKVDRQFLFIIPIEFYDDVRMWDWEVLIGQHHTPVISVKQHKMIKELSNTRKDVTILSLNMITPFIAVFKHKTMVSNKNNNEWKDNDNKCLWYDAGYEDSEDDIVADEQWVQACRSFDIYIERALQEK